MNTWSPSQDIFGPLKPCGLCGRVYPHVHGMGLYPMSKKLKSSVDVSIYWSNAAASGKLNVEPLDPRTKDLSELRKFGHWYSFLVGDQFGNSYHYAPETRPRRLTMKERITGWINS